MRADDEKDHSPPIEKRSVPAGGGAGAAAAPALEHREAEQRLAIARGPRKKVDEGPPKPRLTSHKVRSQWFQARAAWPYREGSPAMDPKNPEVLYCGTGEANLSADSYPGIGVYWSRNAGKKWELLADARQARLPKRIGALAVDPFNSRRIFLGGVNSGIFENQDDLGGLYISEDQGKTWQRFNFISDNNYRCHSIAFHPTWEGWMYATFTEQGNKNGIWRSTDGGRTWVQLTNGLPESPRIGRTSLALCDSKPNMIYAFGADEASESRDLVLGVFRSDDGGDNWREISGK